MSEWYPEAIKRYGPADKFGGYPVGATAPKRGEVKHSMVGSFNAAMGVLDGTRQSSWTFSVLKDGRVFQHYGLSANTWHGNDSDNDGDVRANIDLVGVEHEGGPPGNESEPLTAVQLDATTKLTAWMAAQFGFTTFARYPIQGDAWTLAAHGQVGNAPTACPSGRIPWQEILNRLAATQGDPTLAFRPGLDGLHRVGVYLVTYNAGVPVLRLGGSLPGQLAKRFGDSWRWLRSREDGSIFYSDIEGD